MDTRTDLRGCQKKSASLEQNSDEVVRYMSKLPPYLQGDESLQSNVLNVGVLDWARLENWKKHVRPTRGGGAATNERRKVPSTTTSTHPNARCKVKASFRDVQHSVHGVRCTLEPEFASGEIATCSYKSTASGRDHERVKSPGKSRRRSRSSASGLLSTMGNSGGSLGGAKGNLVVRDKETEKRAGELQDARERATDVEQKTVGGSNHQVSNIVLLRSSKQSRSSILSHISLDDNVKATREVNRSLTSLGFRSQLPPLSFDLERDSEDQRFGGTTRHYSKIFDEEDESRHPTSPSKRFSFSFGRLSRSFTFKEEEEPLTSSHHDAIKSDSFDGPSQSCKQNTQGGSGVSPLRRIRDPLLKSKGSEDVPPKSICSNPKPAANNCALFQLTMRNGIPLFQFVVDDNLNGRSILGATVKTSASSSFKEYCTFYSVNEVKKKKNWLIRGGHKEKQGGFLYNVIGHMRLCNSMSEAVLVDELKEVAAVVIKKQNLKETTVIIPGGVHSIPEKGAPTPLIRRWRSGGLCDCGGWDVGCKLHVLSNLHQLDHQSFQLFHEEESEQNSGLPVLAMTEVKRGIYKVEFGPLLSHLQAFFVCVAVVTCASELVSKTTGKSSSSFAPPLSPVGRV